MPGPLLPPFRPATPEGLMPVTRELAADLQSLRPREAVTWPLALAFNDLLDAARVTCPNDPVLSGIGRLAPGHETANGTLVALLGQIEAALGEAR